MRGRSNFFMILLFIGLDVSFGDPRSRLLNNFASSKLHHDSQNNLELPEPQLRALDKNEIEASSREIRQQIEQINERLTQGEKDTILQEADIENPEGYSCENTIIEVKELKFTEQVRCYNTSEEVCSMVHSTVFEDKEEQRCDTHFKKVCWIDYQDQASVDTITVCNKKPERVCNLSKVELSRTKVMQECKEHYETVCQTSYAQKNVSEDRVSCQMKQEDMCMDMNGKNHCIKVPKRKCETKQVTILKSIPQTKCEQHKREVCTDPICPLVVENEVCQDIEKTFIRKVPKESCEMEPREVCTTVIKQYPSLKMETQCDLQPRETCTPERVQPQLVTRPVIKKICTKNKKTTENPKQNIPIEENIQRMFELFFCAADQKNQDNQLSKEEATSQLGQFYLTWARSILGSDSEQDISEIFDAMDQDIDEQISVDEVVDYYKNLPKTRDAVPYFANVMANRNFSTEVKVDAVTNIIGCACDFDKNNVITTDETNERKCINDQKLIFDNRYIDSFGFQYQDTNNDNAIVLQEATDALEDHIKYEQNYYMFFDGKAEFRSCEHELVKPRNSYYTWLGQRYIKLNCQNHPTDNVRVNIIQKRRGGVNANFFERPWAEYKAGFGEGNNMMLGLDDIHELTKIGLTNLDVIIIGETIQYTDFRIDDETNKYQMLSLQDAQGNHPNVGQKFSTSDQDNDNWIDGHCSEKHTGGWWFDDCGTGNLNGILNNDYIDYQPDNTDPKNEEIIAFWGVSPTGIKKKIGESIMAVWAPKPNIPA